MSAPTSCAAMKPGADDGAMPAKVSDSVLATLTIGLAKLVDEVKKYAPPIHTPTDTATTYGLPCRTAPWITSRSPIVATTSDTSSGHDERSFSEKKTAPRPVWSENITLVRMVPTQPPPRCAPT